PIHSISLQDTPPTQLYTLSLHDALPICVLTAMPEKKVLALRNEWQKTRITTLPEPPREGLATYYAFNGDLSDAFSLHDGKLVRGEVGYEDGPTGKAAEFRGETEVSLGQAGDFD